MSKEIGVMGHPDFVLGFNLAGVRRTYPVETTEEFTRSIERIMNSPENLGILIVPGSDLESLLPYLKKKVTESLDPVVIAMGGDAGQGDLRDKVKRAIGIDLLKE